MADMSNPDTPEAVVPSEQRLSDSAKATLINTFVNMHGDLKEYLRSLLSSREEAEDAFQETFLIVQDYMGTYDETRDFGKWVRGIARNVVLRRRRSMARDRQLSIEQIEQVEQMVAGPSSYESRTKDPNEIGAVRAWLSQLTDEQQRTVLLRYVDRLAVSQIAKEMSKSEAAIYMALSRMRNSLQHCLERHRRQRSGSQSSILSDEPSRTAADDADGTTLALRLLITDTGRAARIDRARSRDLT